MNELPPFFKWLIIFIAACLLSIVAVVTFFALIFVLLVGWEALPWS